MDYKAVRTKFRAIRPVLTERSRRIWAATEAEALGHGGIAAIVARDVAVMHFYRRAFDAALERCDHTIELNPLEWALQSPPALASRIGTVRRAEPLRRIASTAPVWVLRIVGDRGTIDAVAKHTWMSWRGDEGASELANYERFEARVADDGCGAPSPIAYERSRRLLVTAYHDGAEPMRAWLRRTSRRWSGASPEQQRTLERMGAVLAWWHAASDPLASPVPWSAAAEIVSRWLDDQGVHGPRRRRRPGDLLRELHAECEGVSVPHARLHGDFGLHNVGIGGGKLWVYDMTDRLPGAVYNDLAQTHVSLVLLCERYWLGARTLAAFQRAFLEAYRAHAGLALQEPVLRLAIAHEIVAMALNGLRQAEALPYAARVGRRLWIPLRLTAHLLATLESPLPIDPA